MESITKTPQNAMGNPLEGFTFSKHQLVVPYHQPPLRIDKFLEIQLPTTSRTKIKAALNQGLILVNKKNTKANYKVKLLDQIAVTLPHSPPTDRLIPQKLPLNIIYEDPYLLVINKPAGQVVHPAPGHWQGTLVNGLVYHCNHLPDKGGRIGRPGLVHRIDKDTSGLLVVAKTEEALMALAQQFYQRTIQRTYHALVWGTPPQKEGTIKVAIGRNQQARQLMAPNTTPGEGKGAVTHYRVIKKMGHVTLVTCQLETGRTHQIRVHLQYLGHPIFGDPQYGGEQIVSGQHFSSYKAFVKNCFQILPHQALHATSLGFTHPITTKKCYFEVPLPDNFQQVIVKWEKYNLYH